MQQPLFPEPPTSTPGSAEDLSPAPVWLQRMSLIVLVLFCVQIGVIVTVLPWLPRFWDQNGWLLAHPAIREVVRQGWVRGVISALGLLDIWIGVSEAVHYRDYRPSRPAQRVTHGR